MRVQQEPIVPLGALITTGFLIWGLRVAKNGDKIVQSRAMKVCEADISCDD
jgi:hypothetical protein